MTSAHMEEEGLQEIETEVLFWIGIWVLWINDVY
jgi:hypothetical protein